MPSPKRICRPWTSPVLSAAYLFVALSACSDDGSSDEGGPDAAVAVDVPAEDVGIDLGPRDLGAADLGPEDTGPPPDMGVSLQARLETYLLGDFDNQAQFSRGFPQFVERHVCPIPGLPEAPGVTWLYVEHVETVTRGRDAYFIRINRLETEGDSVVSKAYRFPTGHPLRTNAFSFNGPRDACFGRTAFGNVALDDLEYRAGCDVTYRLNGDRFSAISPEQTCTFPGGWIQTQSTVWADGLDSLDRVVSPQGESGSTFEFRRVLDFVPPGG